MSAKKPRIQITNLNPVSTDEDEDIKKLLISGKKAEIEKPGELDHNISSRPRIAIDSNLAKMISPRTRTILPINSTTSDSKSKSLTPLSPKMKPRISIPEQSINEKPRINIPEQTISEKPRINISQVSPRPYIVIPESAKITEKQTPIIVTKDNVEYVKLPKIDTKVNFNKQKQISDLELPKDVPEKRTGLNVSLLSPRSRLLPTKNLEESSELDIKNVVDPKKLKTGRSNADSYGIKELKEIAKKLKLNVNLNKDDLVSEIKNYLRRRGLM